jgi:hypothetical protein
MRRAKAMLRGMDTPPPDANPSNLEGELRRSVDLDLAALDILEPESCVVL